MALAHDNLQHSRIKVATQCIKNEGPGNLNVSYESFILLDFPTAHVLIVFQSCTSLVPNCTLNVKDLLTFEFQITDDRHFASLSKESISWTKFATNNKYLAHSNFEHLATYALLDNLNFISVYFGCKGCQQLLSKVSASNEIKPRSK